MQFSRYISNPSTTTATSSELDPPSVPPPPPPPLNIPPSRARRQLAARLALHSKQNSEINTENGDKVEKAEHRNNLNPFATDEDDDEDEGAEFSIDDVDVDKAGKGVLNDGDESKVKNVGIPSFNHHILANVLSSSVPIGTGLARASFPSMWPFGMKGTGLSPPASKSHFRGPDEADVFDEQNNSSDSEDSDDGFDNEGRRGRRLSVTTEAKRRTSLEDDDEEEGVVHVKMAEADVVEAAKAGKHEGDDGDGELVEIQHAEMQGVEK